MNSTIVTEDIVEGTDQCHTILGPLTYSHTITLYFIYIILLISTIFGTKPHYAKCNNSV